MRMKEQALLSSQFECLERVLSGASFAEHTPQLTEGSAPLVTPLKEGEGILGSKTWWGLHLFFSHIICHPTVLLPSVGLLQGHALEFFFVIFKCGLRTSTS